MLPPATDHELRRERSRAARLVATVLCAAVLLVAGTWAATVAVASSAAGADTDDIVVVESTAPVEVARPQRRHLRPLFFVSRPRPHRRRRTRLTLRPQLLRLCACVPRRGPPALVVR